MKTQQFLEHHGIRSNPFAEEDAQTDPVFKDFCISSTHHPTWDKIYGDPAEPATSIVFGEKGAGKTAMRLQIVRHLEDYNRRIPMPACGSSSTTTSTRSSIASATASAHGAAGSIACWVTGSSGTTWTPSCRWASPDWSTAFWDRGKPTTRASTRSNRAASSLLDRHQARDLLMLAACYDSSSAETTKGRWRRLRRKLRYRGWLAQWDFALGVVATLATAGTVAYLQRWDWLELPWPYVIVAAAWLPWLARFVRRFWQAAGIARNIRVGKHVINPLRQILMKFRAVDIAGQPLPRKQRTDDRYELLAKFQGILKTLGFSGIVVLVDRVDEPHLINGSVEQMRALLWPMLDNKFLKQPGIGLKLLLPIELSQYLEREDRDFYQRARLDKQNMVPSLEWTGEALFDVACARLKACAVPGQTPVLADLFDPSISERRLTDAFRSLRVPRHLFKFMHRLFVAHCNAYTDAAPSWKISSERFESTLALYGRDQDAFDRGLRRVSSRSTTLQVTGRLAGSRLTLLLETQARWADAISS